MYVVSSYMPAPQNLASWPAFSFPVQHMNWDHVNFSIRVPTKNNYNFIFWWYPGDWSNKWPHSSVEICHHKAKYLIQQCKKNLKLMLTMAPSQKGDTICWKSCKCAVRLLVWIILFKKKSYSLISIRIHLVSLEYLPYILVLTLSGIFHFTFN